MFVLPNQVLTAIEKLESNGFEAYIVGGCVRDFLLSEHPDDFDITTSADPEEILNVFKQEKTIKTGLKHGTVTVILDGIPLEITTFRIDTYYSDNRHPDSVVFTKSIKEDLARRDFTVNAMAYSKSRGLVDPFGGRHDLNNKVLRCVGQANKRFNEDSLRIMRGLRFSSVLGFEIEGETSAAIRKNKKLLLNVSSERVAVELKKLVCGKNAAEIITKYHEVLEIILPEIKGMAHFDQKNPHHAYDILYHTAVATANMPPEPSLRLAALFHDCGKMDCFSVDDQGIGHFYGHSQISEIKTDTALRRLKFDNATRQRVMRLVKYHDMQIEVTEKSVKKALGKLSHQGFYDLMAMQRADRSALAPQYAKQVEKFDKLTAIADKIISDKECFSLKDLALKGDDLMALGEKPGKQLGNALEFLLDAVIEGNVENEKEALTAYFKAHFSNEN